MCDKEFEWKGAVVGREEKSLNQLICLPIDHAINRKMKQLINQPIEQLISQSVSQSVSQSINQSIKQSILYVETGGDLIC